MRALSQALVDDAGTWFFRKYQRSPQQSVEDWLNLIVEQYRPRCTQQVEALARREYTLGVDHLARFVNRIVDEMTYFANECCPTHVEQIISLPLSC